MNDGKLGVLLPTFRFDEAARHAITTVCALGRDGINIYIGDNSLDADKWVYLRQLQERSHNVTVFCHAENLGAGGNSAFLYEQQDHEFVCHLSDDDIFSPDYILSGLDELRRNPACAVASGLLLHLTPDGNTLKIAAPGSIVEPTAHQRIALYNNSYNSITYGVFRQQAARRFSVYMRDRPYYPSYMDQFLAYSLLSAGVYVVDQTKKAFLYNNDNWAASSHMENGAKYFSMAGLTKEFQWFNQLNWAVDALHFFHSTYRPITLSDEEAKAIGKFLYVRFFNEFVSLVASNTACYIAMLQNNATAFAAFQLIVNCPPHDVEKIIRAFSEIMRAFNPELADRYMAFAAPSLQLVEDGVS